MKNRVQKLEAAADSTPKATPLEVVRYTVRSKAEREALDLSDTKGKVVIIRRVISETYS